MASPRISLDDLQRWLNAIRTLEGMIRIRLAGKICHLAIDYWVIHQYAFPSHRDIVSEKEHIREKLYQSHIRCDWILNWLPLEWKQPLILPPPYKMELASQLDRPIGPRDFWTLDEAVAREAIEKFIKEFDQKAETGVLPDRIDSKTLDKLYEISKILFLAVTLGTRQGFRKLRDLINPPNNSSPTLLVDAVSDPQKAMWRDVQEHQAEIEKNANSLWELILSKQPGRATKYASNRLDSIALESVRFINSRWNPKGTALILISGAASLLGTLSEVSANQGEIAMSFSAGTQEPLRFPFVVSPDFFSFYLSHAASEDGPLLNDDDVLPKLVASRRGLEAVIALVVDKTAARPNQKGDVFSILWEALGNRSLDKLTHKTLYEHEEFLKSFLNMNRATVLYSSGVNERVPEPVRTRFESAVRHLDYARDEIQNRYVFLVEAAKRADAESILAGIFAAVERHGNEVHELSGLCSFVEMAPQSLNYGFLYKDTLVEDHARTIFRILRAGLSSAQRRRELSDAVWEVHSMAQQEKAVAKLLLAHIKTKLGNPSQDERALQDLEEGKNLLKNGEKHMEPCFDFVRNIAEYHLGLMDDAVSRGERLVKESDGKTARFHLQAGFLRWSRYQQDPEAGSDDLDRAIELALSAEHLSKGDPETHALALANLARAYVEKARLAKEAGNDLSELWGKAAELMEASAAECREFFGEAQKWPACIVFAAGFVGYELWRRTYDPSTMSREDAREAFGILKERMSNLLPVLDENKRWQRPKVAGDYRALLKKIGRYMNELEYNTQGMPLELRQSGQAQEAGPPSDNDSDKPTPP